MDNKNIQIKQLGLMNLHNPYWKIYIIHIVCRYIYIYVCTVNVSIIKLWSNNNIGKNAGFMINLTCNLITKFWETNSVMDSVSNAYKNNSKYTPSIFFLLLSFLLLCSVYKTVSCFYFSLYQTNDLERKIYRILVLERIVMLWLFFLSWRRWPVSQIFLTVKARLCGIENFCNKLEYL